MISKLYKSNQERREIYSDGPKAERRSPNPTMRWTGKRYEVRECFDVRDQIKKYGFQWDPQAKCWHTEEPKKAVKAIRYADKATKDMLTYLMTN